MEVRYHKKLMMKNTICDWKLLLIINILLSSMVANGQSLLVSSNQLNFGTVDELTVDSIQLTLTNNANSDVQITGYDFYTTYGQPAFSTVALNQVVPFGGNISIWIRFQPRHNIYHNSELIIKCDGGKGFARVDLVGQGTYSKAYYSTSQNLEEEALKLELKSIITANYVNLIYAPARDTMFMKIDNKLVNGQGATQNTIECVYTGREAVGYIDRTDCQTNYSFNTEHTFPQGLFASAEPMRSDIFHLFPTDDNANNVRGSLPFGMVSNPTWTDGGSRCDNTLFEPRDEHKGKAARAMMYFVIRYQDYTGFFAPQQGILKQWNQQFLPNTEETTRNSRTQIAQGNRNPFIDYPQFADRITTFSSTSVSFDQSQLTVPFDTIDFGSVDITLTNTYKFWMVNSGNRELSVYNFNLTPNSVLSFANGTGVPTTIQPGEALALDIDLANAAPGLLSGFINYAVQGPGLLATITNPIKGNLSITGIEENVKSNLVIYPNPAENYFCISDNLKQSVNIRLIDLQGRIVDEQINTNENCFDLDESILPGIYIVEIYNAISSHRNLLIKQ
jgi:hypothetical protein